MIVNKAERAHSASHHHVFLGEGHETKERKTWAVIALCSVMMIIEIGGGTLYGSLALVADGLHMASHALAILIAALAYRFARRHASNRSFTFGTGKIGDLAGFSSAIILAMIALLVGYEAVSRLFQPVSIHFQEAIPIAVLGLAVNVASAWLLSSGARHSHGHDHGPLDTGSPGEAGEFSGERRAFTTPYGDSELEIYEIGVPPRFRLHFGRTALRTIPPAATLTTVRPEGVRQVFEMRACGRFLESTEEIPEPHEFKIIARIGDGVAAHEELIEFSEVHGGHSHATHHDHNFRSAFVHVVGDAAVSVLAIFGLVAARYLGWIWMDPVMGLIGAAVIAVWGYSLIKATARVLVDVTPDAELEHRIRTDIEECGDSIVDLHLWRVGPGHLAAIVSVASATGRSSAFYRERLARFRHLSHITVEVHSPDQ